MAAVVEETMAANIAVEDAEEDVAVAEEVVVAMAGDEVVQLLIQQ
jgi:hypothetical protein